MTHPFRAWRTCAVLVAAPALLAQADFPGRLGNVEAILDRHFRGESLERAQTRVNALVDAYNALLDAYNAEVKARNRAMEDAQAQEPRELGPSPRLEAALKAHDAAFAPPLPGAGAEALAAHQARLRLRNAIEGQYGDLRALTHLRTVGARSARLFLLDAALDQDRKALEVEQRDLQARRDEDEAFSARGGDLAFFCGVNQLLADIRAACRLGPDPGNRAALDQIRKIRQELARWAADRQATQPNGLVLVTALVGDEPCCFIVDTGAQVVCLPSELIEALGLTGTLGEEVTHTLAGGQKTRGRSLTFPRVAAAGMAAAEVAGSVLPASEVGIDGLLGQSFLKRFVYTIDEGRPGKLILAERQLAEHRR